MKRGDIYKREDRLRNSCSKTSNMTYKLIIFDFDGVIVKSNSILRNVTDNFDKYDLVERSAMSFTFPIGDIPCVGPISKLCVLSAIEVFSGEYEPIMEVANFIKYTPGYKMAILSSDTRPFIEKQFENIQTVATRDNISFKPHLPIHLLFLSNL